MSNLGGYQTIVQTVKALGGPKKATAIAVPAVAVAGYGILRSVEAGVKGVIASRGAIAQRHTPYPARNQLFEVTCDGADGDGLELRTGDQYRVLEGDADAICIEVLGSQSNPHFVSDAFLSAVSDFPAGPQVNGE